MTIQNHSVVVKQLPRTLSGRQEQVFLREIQGCMDAGRPRMVLDCSCLRELDSSVIHLLLCCLEEAMKHNGDVKLASLPPGGAVILELTGTYRLFDVYDTTADAVNSYQPQPARMASQVPPQGNFHC